MTGRRGQCLTLLTSVPKSCSFIFKRKQKKNHHHQQQQKLDFFFNAKYPSFQIGFLILKNLCWLIKTTRGLGWDLWAAGRRFVGSVGHRSYPPFTCGGPPVNGRAGVWTHSLQLQVRESGHHGQQFPSVLHTQADGLVPGTQSLQSAPVNTASTIRKGLSRLVGLSALPWSSSGSLGSHQVRRDWSDLAHTWSSSQHSGSLGASHDGLRAYLVSPADVCGASLHHPRWPWGQEARLSCCSLPWHRGRKLLSAFSLCEPGVKATQPPWPVKLYPDGLRVALTFALTSQRDLRLPLHLEGHTRAFIQCSVKTPNVCDRKPNSSHHRHH